MKSVAIYIRTSTVHQNSEIQINDTIEYCQKRGWEVIGVFEDKLSGRNLKRPEFTKILELARQRKIDILVCWKLDRCFRSIHDCVNTLQELGSLGVEFVSLRDSGIDMTTPSGKLMLTIIAAFAAFEADMIRMRVRAGLDNAKKKGIRLGRPNTVQENKIFELAAQGLSVRKIAKELGIGKSSVQKYLKNKKTQNQ